MKIAQASFEDLDPVAELFDQYRVFYQQASNLSAAQQFLGERLRHQDSVIFLAWDGEITVGFTQLYPSFSSVSMGRIWILNDLFVAPSHRGQGIAKELMDAAEDYARQSGALRVGLSTQITNTSAQKLYESRGYVRDTEFYHYDLSLKP